MTVKVGETRIFIAKLRPAVRGQSQNHVKVLHIEPRKGRFHLNIEVQEVNGGEVFYCAPEELY